MTGATTPVLIVGAGPVGLAAALVLGRHGISSLVCERHAGINPHPRAHVVNTRSMELFRSWGVADAVHTDAVAPQWTQNIVWKTTLAGTELGRVTTGDGAGNWPQRRVAASPEVVTSCAQDRVQQHLLEAVRRQAQATVEFGTTVTGLRNHDDHVQVNLRTSQGARTVRADYVIAADGAGGTIRDALGIAMEGLPVLSQMINIYFHADLSPWTEDDPALLVWALNTDSPGVFVGMDGIRRWTFQRFHDPAVETLESFTTARCADLVRAAVGSPDLDVDVLSVRPWTAAAQTAVEYRCGRVFLAGDCAHQFPPTGGLGMNTGLADADNLGWKIAAVLDDWASGAILDTYVRERRPIAIQNTQRSVENILRMIEAGFNPMSDHTARLLESAEPGIAAAERERLAASIPLQRPHFDDLDLEIGYVYGERAASKDPITDAMPGGRLPHVWVDRHGARISSLDLIGAGLTLITGADGAAWADAMTHAAAGKPWRAFVLGRDVESADARRLGVGTAGAVLIRPDGHIAWLTDRQSADPVHELRTVIGALCECGPTAAEPVVSAAPPSS